MNYFTRKGLHLQYLFETALGWFKYYLCLVGAHVLKYTIVENVVCHILLLL